MINKKKLSQGKTQLKDRVLLASKFLAKKQGLMTMPHKLDEKKMPPTIEDLHVQVKTLDRKIVRT